MIFARAIQPSQALHVYNPRSIVARIFSRDVLMRVGVYINV